MEKIKILRAYNFVNADGVNLQLHLGRYENTDCIPYKVDMGYRWAFNGTKIPMPVRSGTWFNGFPESVMLDWLKENGWALRSCVNMSTGRVSVYELPFMDKVSKGNESSNEMEMLGTDQFPERSNMDKPIFERVINDLANEGLKATACRVYRYAHGGTLRNALHAVNEICNKT